MMAADILPDMLRDVLSRIEMRLSALDLSATAASRKAGLSEDAIRNLRRAVEKDDRQGISTATLTALAPVLETTASWLLEGREAGEPAYVPIIGRVGADPEGTILFSYGQGTGEEAQVPPGGTLKARALLVKGHSMKGYADDGALIFFEDQRTPPTPDMLQQPCVVETEEGEVLVKRLLKGTAKGLYDLESINGPTLEDKRLKWAAEIIAVIPPRQAARIRRDVTERQVA